MIFSHYRTVYFLKTKDEVKRKLEIFLNRTENLGIKVKKMRSDNDTEVVNKEVEVLLENAGILRQFSVPYAHEQNGRCECEMRTIVEMARTMLQSEDLGKCLWAEAVNYAVQILNAVGTSTVGDKTPQELWLKFLAKMCMYIFRRRKGESAILRVKKENLLDCQMGLKVIVSIFQKWIK